MRNLFEREKRFETERETDRQASHLWSLIKGLQNLWLTWCRKLEPWSQTFKLLPVPSQDLHLQQVEIKSQSQKLNLHMHIGCRCPEPISLPMDWISVLVDVLKRWHICEIKWKKLKKSRNNLISVLENTLHQKCFLLNCLTCSFYFLWWTLRASFGSTGTELFGPCG